MMRSRPAGNMEAGLPLHGDTAVAGALVLVSHAFKKLFEEVYRSFLEEMQEENLTDFAGVLVTLRDLLSSPENAWIKERYNRQFKHIIVDEFRTPTPCKKRFWSCCGASIATSSTWATPSSPSTGSGGPR